MMCKHYVYDMKKGTHPKLIIVNRGKYLYILVITNSL